MRTATNLPCPGDGDSTIVKKSKRETFPDIVRRVPLSVLHPLLKVTQISAARALQISPTTLKKLCRHYGIVRWPYRQIAGLDRAFNRIDPCLTGSPAGNMTSSSDEERVHQYRCRRENEEAFWLHLAYRRHSNSETDQEGDHVDDKKSSAPYDRPADVERPPKGKIFLAPATVGRSPASVRADHVATVPEGEANEHSPPAAYTTSATGLDWNGSPATSSSGDDKSHPMTCVGRGAVPNTVTTMLQSHVPKKDCRDVKYKGPAEEAAHGVEVRTVREAAPAPDVMESQRAPVQNDATMPLLEGTEVSSTERPAVQGYSSSITTVGHATYGGARDLEWGPSATREIHPSSFTSCPSITLEDLEHLNDLIFDDNIDVLDSCAHVTPTSYADSRTMGRASASTNASANIAAHVDDGHSFVGL